MGGRLVCQQGTVMTVSSLHKNGFYIGLFHLKIVLETQAIKLHHAAL